MVVSAHALARAKQIGYYAHSSREATPYPCGSIAHDRVNARSASDLAAFLHQTSLQLCGEPSERLVDLMIESTQSASDLPAFLHQTSLQSCVEPSERLADLMIHSSSGLVNVVVKDRVSCSIFHHTHIA